MNVDPRLLGLMKMLVDAIDRNTQATNKLANAIEDRKEKP